MSTDSPFLVLPAELRLEIYESLFATVRGVVIDERSYRKSRALVYVNGHANLQILRVCRQFYDEALPVFFRNQIFLTNSHSAILPTISKYIGLQNATLIRNIKCTLQHTFNWPNEKTPNATESFSKEVQNMRTLIGALPNLRMLELEFNIGTFMLDADLSRGSINQVAHKKTIADRTHIVIEAAKGLSRVHPLRMMVRRWPHARKHIFLLLTTLKYKPIKWVSHSFS
jgi:hypothetical protein